MLGRLPGTRNQKGKETERVSSVRVLFQKRTLVYRGQKNDAKTTPHNGPHTDYWGGGDSERLPVSGDENEGERERGP